MKELRRLRENRTLLWKMKGLSSERPTLLLTAARQTHGQQVDDKLKANFWPLRLFRSANTKLFFHARPVLDSGEAWPFPSRS